jgi:integrase
MASRRGIYQWRGNWCIDYRDQRGKRHVLTARNPRTGTSSKAFAAQLLEEKLAAVHEGKHVAPGDARMTFRQLGEKFLASKAAELSKLTHRDYSDIVTILTKEFADTRLNDITAARVEEFRNAQVAAGYEAASVNKQLRILAAAFSLAVSRRWAAENPATAVRRLKLKARREEDGLEVAKVLQPSEVTALLVAADELADEALPLHATFRHAPACHAAALWLIAHTGLRASEALGLVWGDLDFEAGELAVRRRYRLGEIADPKSASSVRRVPLSATLVARLRVWLAQTPHKSSEAPVFSTSAGKRESADNLRARGLAKAARRAKLARVPTLHALRHTYGSLLIHAGINLQRVSTLLGHADVAITARCYIHDLQSLPDDSAQRLEAMLAPPSNKIATSGPGGEAEATEAKASA